MYCLNECPLTTIVKRRRKTVRELRRGVAHPSAEGKKGCVGVALETRVHVVGVSRVRTGSASEFRRNRMRLCATPATQVRLVADELTHWTLAAMRQEAKQFHVSGQARSLEDGESPSLQAHDQSPVVHSATNMTPPPHTAIANLKEAAAH
jgi:hypothetical protein